MTERAVSWYDHRWVSCALALSWEVGRYSHLLKNSLDTLCGASASERGVWRGSKVKPHCPECERLDSESA